MGTFRLLNLSDADLWKSYLYQLPKKQRDIYFTPEYYGLYENLGDGEAMCFVFIDENHFALYPFLLNLCKSINLYEIAFNPNN